MKKLICALLMLAMLVPMMSVFASAAAPTNLYVAADATIGTPAKTKDADASGNRLYVTSSAIAVKAGDVVTFGPVLPGQGYYITTYDADGKEMDKTKLELGDDKEKTGVYEMSFTVENFGTKNLTYDIGAYVMTEGVSETLTNAGKTTVTEEAYILEGAVMEITSVEGGKLSGIHRTLF